MDETLPIEDRVDKEVFAAIGLAITTWSAVERALALHLMHLLRAERASSEDSLAAFAVTHGMDVRTLLGLMKSIVGVRFPAYATEFAEMADNLSEAFTKRRNILAHSAFGIGKKSDRIAVYVIRTVGKMEADEYDLTAKEIRNWALDFHKQGLGVDSFFARLGLPRTT